MQEKIIQEARERKLIRQQNDVQIKLNGELAEQDNRGKRDRVKEMEQK